MIDILLFVTAVTSSLAAIFGLLMLLGVGRSGMGGEVGSALRMETDRTRSEATEHARQMREELADSLDRFQENLRIRLQSGIDAIRTPVTEIGKKLDADIARMGQEAHEARDVLRQTVEAKLDAFDRRSSDASRALREELTGNFRNSSEQLSATLKDLGAHQNERLENLARQIAEQTEKQNSGQEALRTTVEGRLDAIRTENAQKLDQMRETVDEKLQSTLEQRLGESFRTVSEHLKAVHEGLGEMQNLATGVGDLKKVLTNVKIRGTMAETQLGAQLAQFLSAEQYIQNAQCKDGSLERVEFAIRIPDPSGGEILLPIDAKFPQEDYDRIVHASEAGDSTALDQAINAFETRIRGCAKTISEKYLNPPTTTDFALLYLPTEGLFAEVLRRPGLFDSLHRQYHVAVTGPTTLTAVLSAFQMGFRSIAINQRADEVWKLLGAVRKEFENHGTVVTKLRKQLNTASNTIDELGRRTRAMNRHLREVEFIPSQGAPDLLGLAKPEIIDDEDSDPNADVAVE